MSCNGNCNGECADCQDCSCPEGRRGSITRTGNGVPTVLSTDLPYDLYIQLDSSPTGEIWQFNGTAWIDTGIATTGDAGAAGQNGTTIINNDETAVSTTVNAVTDLITYPMPANTLQSDGDEILIDSYFTTDPSNNTKEVRVLWDTAPLTILLYSAAMVKAHLQYRVVRISSVSVKVHWMANVLTVFGGLISQTDLFGVSPVAVADLSANPITIKAQGKSSAAGETVTSQYLKIEYKHKV